MDARDLQEIKKLSKRYYPTFIIREPTEIQEIAFYKTSQRYYNSTINPQAKEEQKIRVLKREINGTNYLVLFARNEKEKEKWLENSLFLTYSTRHKLRDADIEIYKVLANGQTINSIYEPLFRFKDFNGTSADEILRLLETTSSRNSCYKFDIKTDDYNNKDLYFYKNAFYTSRSLKPDFLPKAREDALKILSTRLLYCLGFTASDMQIISLNSAGNEVGRTKPFIADLSVFADKEDKKGFNLTAQEVENLPIQEGYKIFAIKKTDYALREVPLLTKMLKKYFSAYRDKSKVPNYKIEELKKGDENYIAIICDNNKDLDALGSIAISIYSYLKGKNKIFFNTGNNFNYFDSFGNFLPMDRAFLCRSPYFNQKSSELEQKMKQSFEKAKGYKLITSKKSHCVDFYIQVDEDNSFLSESGHKYKDSRNKILSNYKYQLKAPISCVEVKHRFPNETQAQK